MHQPRTNLSKVFPASRKRGAPRSTEPVATPSASPLDALVRGLASIGERFVRGGKVQYRIP
jgi:hypothetical protein